MNFQDMKTEKQRMEMEEDKNYIASKNIIGIFNELSAKLIYTKPENKEEIKKQLVYEQKKMSYSNRMEYFEDEDFELMFRTFDFFKKDEIPLSYLFHGLNVINYEHDRDAIITKYKLSESENLGKKAFLKIMKREYNKMITLENS